MIWRSNVGRPYNKKFQQKLSKRRKEDEPAKIPKRSNG